MASMSELHRQSFEDRLARIRQGGPNTIGEVHIGPREEVRARDAKAAVKVLQSRKKKRRGSIVSTLLVLPVAAALGAFSIFAGRVAAFQLFSEEGLYSVALAGVPATMFADILIASVLAMVLAWTFHMTYGLRRVAIIGGFVAMMTGEFMLIQEYPEVFSAFFSDTYVTAVLANPPATL
jgi:hypothetical protein